MGDEPTGRFGRWGQVASALATFGVLSFVIVYAILHLLVGAAAWVMLAASVPIAVFSIAWGFTVVDDEDLDGQIPDSDDDSDWTFQIVKPSGTRNWLRKIGSALGGMLGLFFVIGIPFNLAGLPVSEWSNPVQFIVFWTVVIFALLMEFTTLGDDEDESPATPAYAPAADNNNARFHQRDHKG